jgi:uncharacterized membrane protein
MIRRLLFLIKAVVFATICIIIMPFIIAMNIIMSIACYLIIGEGYFEGRMDSALEFLNRFVPQEP